MNEQMEKEKELQENNAVTLQEKKSDDISATTENSKLEKKDLKDENSKDVTKKKNKKLIIGIIIGTLLLLFLCIFSVIFSIIFMNDSKILPNIKINNIDVSNMSKEEAISTLEKLATSKKEQTIDLSYESSIDTQNSDNTNAENQASEDVSNSNNLNFKDLELEYDINQAVEKALSSGKNGNLLQNNYSILHILLKGSNINLNFTFNKDALNSILDNISSNLPNKVIQNSYYIEFNNLIITKGTAGNAVDKEKFDKDLTSVIYNISSNNVNYIKVPITNIEPDDIDINKIHSEVFKEAKNAYYEKEPFKVYNEVKGIDFDIENALQILKEDKKEYTIPLIITEPEIKVENLNINVFPDLLGNFTTKYDASNTSRSTNLRLAANKINGTILSPGEVFSYNKVVGERTIEAGYKEAKIYSAGQVVDGLGGGICQISSTLYNAVMFANLDVIERHNHQFVTSYVKEGRDATVVYGAKDFKFKNSRSYPIKIVCTVNGGIATASIYGIKEEVEYEVSFSIDKVSVLNYSVQYVEDSSIPLGTEKVKQKGTSGIIVKDYKVVKLNGNVVSKTFIAQDTYNSMPRIILQGTGATPNSNDSQPTPEPNPIPTPEPEPTPPPSNNTNSTNSTDTNNSSTNNTSNNTENILN